MKARSANRLREQVHLLPMLIHNPLTYDDLHNGGARVLRVRSQGIRRIEGRCDREGQGLLRFVPVAGDAVPGGRPHRRALWAFDPLCSTFLNRSVWLGSQDPASRSRDSISRRSGNGSVEILYRVNAAVPRWSRNLIRVHRMMRVPAVPAATSSRLVPESMRVEVHEHAYVQSTLCGSQRQTSCLPFLFSGPLAGSACIGTPPRSGAVDSFVDFGR